MKIIKKIAVRCNGINTLQIRTLNGSYSFENQHYIDTQCISSSFLSQGERKGVLETLCYYATKLSYHDVSDLLIRISGKKKSCSRPSPNGKERPSKLMMCW